MKQLAVFASGSGTNFQAVLDAIHSGYLTAQITGLITDRSDIQAIERAETNDIPVYILTDPSDSDHLLAVLEACDPDLIILAGYLKKVPEPVIEAYENRMINIHPSLLPKYGGHGFYGSKVHRAVLGAGDRVTGCSVHMVTKEYDEGPVIDRMEVPVMPDDDASTLAARVLEKEHELLPRVVKHLLNRT